LLDNQYVGPLVISTSICICIREFS